MAPWTWLRPVRLTRAARRTAEIATNLRLAASVAVAHLGEDPLVLAVQVARRLPAAWRSAVAGALRTTASRGRASRRVALAAWVSDHPDEASAAVRALTDAGRTGRLVRELAGQLGLPVPGDGAAAARAAWTRGDVTGALDALDPSERLATRYRAERAVLTGAYRPALARGREGPPAPDGSGAPGPRVLHVLTNSRPHTHSGYSARSHAVLAAQQAAGVRVRAATRLAYPVSIGRPLASHRDVVDRVRYDRLLPGTLPRTLPERLHLQARMLLPLASGAQVLHTTTDWTNALVTRALAEHLGLPWVYEVRGFLEDTWAARRAALGQPGAEGTERYRLLRERETEQMLTADHVVTLSTAMADQIAERGVPRERVTVVPNGVGASMLEPGPGPAAARRLLGLPDGGFWVGTISSLVDYEGLGTVLEAVAALRERGVDARALVVGDGVARPGLLAHAKRLGLGDHAVLPGRVPAAQAVDYHRALDVFTVPRRDVRVCRVVTPLKPIEAMAVGRPVVASDLPALREVVAEPQTGVMAPAGDVAGWADALADLAADDDARARLGENGRRFAASRTWDAAGATYRALYEALVAA